MANSILGSGNPSKGNPMNMLQQFRQFRQQMAGQNPQQMVNQLVQSGQMSPEQRDGLMQQAQSMMSMFRR